jgi:multiple sugar transport system substrate-binding protein
MQASSICGRHEKSIQDTLCETGLLVDLTPLIKKEGIDLSQEYSEGPWREVLYQNKVYALPTNTDARVLFYNKQLLKEGGIDLKEFDPAKRWIRKKLEPLSIPIGNGRRWATC